MLAPCREELAKPNVAILTEVFFAAKGSRLQFFRGDGSAIKLSSQDSQGIAKAMLAAGAVRGDGGDIVFDSDLPLMYGVVRPSIVMGCPFSVKTAGNAEYRTCVQRLATPERGMLLAEASGVLRREFADVIRKPSPRSRSRISARPMQ